MRIHPSPIQLSVSILALSCLGFVIWWMSANVVWLGDDIDYKYMMKGEIWQSWGKIHDWHEFLQSQLIHYQHINGRFAAHALVQLFNGKYGQSAFAVCNAIIYMIFALAIAKTGYVDFRKNTGGIISAVCLSVVCFVTKMTPTCQIGYIWGMLVNLLWISVFFAEKKSSWITVGIMFFVGIAAGNWQESVSIGVCAGLGLWWLSQFFNRNKTTHNFFDWRRSWMMLGYFIGTAFNCLSPATLSRVETVSTPLTDQLIISSYSLPAVFILIAAIIILSINKKLNIRYDLKIENGRIPDGFLISALALLLVFNAIIGIYSNRQLFGANLFALILFFRIIPCHRLNNALNLIAAAAVACIWMTMYYGIEEVRRQYDDIVSLHKESEDGTVEYDRRRVMTIGHPSDAKYYEDIIGQFDNDLHHSLMKDFKLSRGGRTLKLKPAVAPDSVRIEQYAPGHFYVTVIEPKDGEPLKEVTVFGHYSILGIIDIAAKPRQMKLLKYSRRRKPYATAVVIPEYPLFTADSITL